MREAFSQLVSACSLVLWAAAVPWGAPHCSVRSAACQAGLRRAHSIVAGLWGAERREMPLRGKLGSSSVLHAKSQPGNLTACVLPSHPKTNQAPIAGTLRGMGLCDPCGSLPSWGSVILWFCTEMAWESLHGKWELSWLEVKNWWSAKWFHLG